MPGACVRGGLRQGLRNGTINNTTCPRQILDEPHAQQSQRTVLELQLRAQTKRLGMNEVQVCIAGKWCAAWVPVANVLVTAPQIQSIAHAEKNPGAIKGLAFVRSPCLGHARLIVLA